MGLNVIRHHCYLLLIVFINISSQCLCWQILNPKLNNNVNKNKSSKKIINKFIGINKNINKNKNGLKKLSQDYHITLNKFFFKIPFSNKIIALYRRTKDSLVGTEYNKTRTIYFVSLGGVIFIFIASTGYNIYLNRKETILKINKDDDPEEYTGELNEKDLEDSIFEQKQKLLEKELYAKILDYSILLEQVYAGNELTDEKKLKIALGGNISNQVAKNYSCVLLEAPHANKVGSDIESAKPGEPLCQNMIKVLLCSPGNFETTKLFTRMLSNTDADALNNDNSKNIRKTILENLQIHLLILHWMSLVTHFDFDNKTLDEKKKIVLDIFNEHMNLHTFIGNIVMTVFSDVTKNNANRKNVRLIFDAMTSTLRQLMLLNLERFSNRDFSSVFPNPLEKQLQTSAIQNDPFKKNILTRFQKIVLNTSKTLSEIDFKVPMYPTLQQFIILLFGKDYLLQSMGQKSSFDYTINLLKDTVDRIQNEMHKNENNGFLLIQTQEFWDQTETEFMKKNAISIQDEEILFKPKITNRILRYCFTKDPQVNNTLLDSIVKDCLLIRDVSYPENLPFDEKHIRSIVINLRKVFYLIISYEMVRQGYVKVKKKK